MNRILLAAATPAMAAALTSGCTPAQDPAPVQPAQSSKAGKASVPRKAPIALKAVKTAFKASPLHTGGAFTSVKVTITNNTAKSFQVNPLFFAITDTGGTKHDTSTALGEDLHQIGTVTLAPGERATGVVSAEGKFVPKTVAFARDGLDETARVEVG